MAFICAGGMSVSMMEDTNAAKPGAANRVCLEQTEKLLGLRARLNQKTARTSAGEANDWLGPCYSEHARTNLFRC